MKKLLLLLLLPCLLAACKVELYSNLVEAEANDMMALLLRNGIDCEKSPGQEQFWILKVSQADTARALDILKSSGYPRAAFSSMGEIFKKEGLVSSPLEERVRFIYALSQEISHTISQIDGVLAARVHIVLPENNPLSDHIKPSAASIFVKYRPDVNIQAYIPQIKALVTNSIEGLSYDKVSVVLFESQLFLTLESELSQVSVLGLKMARESVTRFWILLGSLLLTMAAAAGLGGYIFLHFRRMRARQTPTSPAEQHKD